jgi:hypothetical protein
MAYIGKSPTGTGVRSRYYYTATGGETSLSGADDNSNTLVFSDGNYVDVSLNGIALVAGTDYNTSTANTIAGLSALSASDIVEVVVYDIFTVADTVSAKDGGAFSGSVTVNGTLTATSFSGNGSALTGLGGGTSVAVIVDEKTQGTAGGASTAGSWFTRDLNTELADPDGIVSVTSNQFTLGAGKYLIEFSVPGHRCGKHRARLYNSTATSVVAESINQQTDANANVTTIATGNGYVDISSSTVFEIQQRVTTTRATNGLGLPFNLSGEVEFYTQVTIFKIG